MNNTTISEGAEQIYAVPTGIVILLSLFYGGISLIAILGNALVIFIVRTSSRMKSIINCYICNLALADIVIGIFSIPFQFQAALLQRWNLPTFMCPVCPFFQNVSVNISIFTLVAIARDRYKAILFPLTNHPSKRVMQIKIGAIWCSSIIIALPQAIAFEVIMVDEDIPQCYPSKVSILFLKWYMFSLFFIQYFVPLLLISYAYIAIAVKLWGSKIPGAAQRRRDASVLKNKKRTIKVLITVVILFGLAWLPLQVYSVANTVYPKINNYKFINILWFCAHWLAMSNSCYNPFIYLLCHEKFKKEFTHRFKFFGSNTTQETQWGQLESTINRGRTPNTMETQ
ncbi:tachykinin-like peptides receptor 99D [Lepeophtheirus salmonis]|uniref:Neuropeptide receptor A23 [Bombyx mori] n=1 Tax=Lepeophtheirus salmonis TaxID=72036 RepID=A0A0K2SYM0_LEPSM|nr:tachykinin-like peptides receptor 99D [Lepeophtheirus salmonis]